MYFLISLFLEKQLVNSFHARMKYQPPKNFTFYDFKTCYNVLEVW